MTDDTVTADILERLSALDTPTVCNAIELVEPDRRGFGFTTRMLHCVRPELGAMTGIARTVLVRAARPSADSAETAREKRFGYLDYVASAAAPTISLVQDLDDGQIGFGAFWGEVNSAIHSALGCVGTITNGCVRDLDALAPGFQALAGSIAPSHGYIHVEDFGAPVTIAGMTVRSGDLVHADRHGGVVIPRGHAAAVLDAADLMARREAVVLEVARKPGASVAEIKQAMLDMAKVT